MNSKTRATLLERLRNGEDSLAWDEFFRRYGRLVYAFARRRGCSDHTAEEIVQEVMLKVFEQRDFFQYDPQLGRFRAWLGTVVRNKVAEHRRRPSERARARGGDSGVGTMEPEAEQPGPDAVWEAAFEDALLAILLDVVRREIDPRTYLAFELFTLNELPGAKVAWVTGMTRNAVYKAGRRVLKRLRELGATYRHDGQLNVSLKRALRSRPHAAVERSLTNRLEKTMWLRNAARDTPA